MKLEITKKLEGLEDKIWRDDFVAMLNLPDANVCEKRSELVVVNGELEQACLGCITQGIMSTGTLSIDEIKQTIDYFAENYGTKFITINGRGDPMHPRLKARTLGKIKYAAEKGIQSYIFTAGQNLDTETCQTLADYEVNVMMSLFGNRFIDADFFNGKNYAIPTERRMQNEALIAENFRRLIRTYTENQSKPEDGTARLGMNYAISERDIEDGGEKLLKLKEAAHKSGICFIVSTLFQPHQDIEVQRKLVSFGKQHTDTIYSTGVGGQCQMGAGSSVTVDFNGSLYRCPYINGRGDGNFLKLSEEGKREVIRKYLQSRGYACVVRRDPIITTR